MTDDREVVVRVLWEADPDSVALGFDDLPCNPALDNLYDTAGRILEALSQTDSTECLNPIAWRPLPDPPAQQ